MLAITFDASDLKRLQRAAAANGKNFKTQVRIAISRTNTKVRSDIAKRLNDDLNVTQSKVKPLVNIVKKPSNTDLTGIVQLDYTKRPTLDVFSKTRHINAGISYKIGNAGGRTRVKGFMGPRPGVMATKLKGVPYKRKGTSRMPIVKLHGISFRYYYQKKGYVPLTVAVGSAELRKQIDRRIRELKLNMTGAIRLKK